MGTVMVGKKMLHESEHESAGERLLWNAHKISWLAVPKKANSEAGTVEIHGTTPALRMITRSGCLPGAIRRRVHGTARSRATRRASTSRGIRATGARRDGPANVLRLVERRRRDRVALRKFVTVP